MAIGAPRMATRFDRVTTPHRPRPTEQAQPSAGLRFRPPPAMEALTATHAEAPGRVDGRVLPVRPLAAAMSTWLVLVLASCYLVGPLALSAAGLAGGAQIYTFAAIPAFGLTAFATTIAVLAARPAIRLGSTRADPILAAVLGSLVVWGVTQNGVPGLLHPFSAMSAPELVAQAALEALEASLLGVMFASFTRSAAAAFALGALFKLVLMGLALGLLSLLTLV
jgi:hypothetical protein